MTRAWNCDCMQQIGHDFSFVPDVNHSNGTSNLSMIMYQQKRVALTKEAIQDVGQGCHPRIHLHIRTTAMDSGCLANCQMGSARKGNGVW